MANLLGDSLHDEEIGTGTPQDVSSNEKACQDFKGEIEKVQTRTSHPNRSSLLLENISSA